MNGTAVWLYGSTARGDAADDSDIDVLVVGTDTLSSSLGKQFPGKRLSVSNYSWQELSRMAGYGSLFLHHVHAEGRPLDSSEASIRLLPELLSGLRPYSRARRDVRAFQGSLDDIRGEAIAPVSASFELALLAALIRRIGILGSYLAGTPDFGRHSAVRKVIVAWGLPSTIAEEFPSLYEYRLAMDGYPIQIQTEASTSYITTWLNRASTMLGALEEQTL